jgi:glucose/arabinose dehydrogenase
VTPDSPRSGVTSRAQQDRHHESSPHTAHRSRRASLVAACAGSTSTTTSSTTTLIDIGAGIKGPSGLKATVYAGSLTHAAAFALDASQRLWVATAAYTDSGKDGVYLVASTGAPVEVISRLHTPLGLVWHDGTLYVASKARVDAYSGLQGTKFTKHRTVLTLPTDVGEVNNMVLSPGGRLLVGISAPCDHCTPTSKYSGAIISVASDGTGLQVYASGIRAPVGLTFYPGTSDLFVSMDYRDDLGAATTGDALAVVRLGTGWRNPECYGQGGAGCTGIKNPVAVTVAGDDAILVGDWTTGTIYRVAAS